MNKEMNEPKEARLTDEELERVVGGKIQWGELLKYLQSVGGEDPGVIDLTAAVKGKDWDKAIDIAARIGKTQSKRYPDFNKYFC